MKHHAKASSAGSTQRQASGLGRIFRGALATRGATGNAEGSGAPSGRRGRLPLLSVAALALLALALAASAGASQVVFNSIGGPSGGFGGSFSNPRDIAVNDTGAGPADVGDFYVAEEGNNRIQRFDSEGNFVSAWGKDTIAPTVDERQRFFVYAEEGTYTLSFNGSTTTPLSVEGNPNGFLGAIRTALAALPSVGGEANVAVSGEYSNGRGEFTVTFQGALAAADQPQLTADISQLEGTVVVKTHANGTATTADTGTDFEICTVAAECKSGIASGGNGATSGDGTLNAPQSVAVDSDTGNVYVSDRGNRRIDEYDGEGNFIASFGWNVDETEAGTEYEVCPAAHVCQAGVAGSGVGQYGSGSETGTFGIAVSPANGETAVGQVYLADSGNRRIDSYGLDGTAPASFGSSAVFGFGSEGNLLQPSKVAVDSRGIVYASNSRGGGEIERYDTQNADGGGVGFLTPISASVNETQVVHFTGFSSGDHYQLTCPNGEATPPSFEALFWTPFHEASQVLESGLERYCGHESFRATGNQFGTELTVEFDGSFAATNVPQMTCTPSGSAGNCSVSTVENGAKGVLLDAGPFVRIGTGGLAVHADSDGAGPDADTLYVQRNPEQGDGNRANTVVQQLGPANPPGLATAPSAADDSHAASGDLGLGYDDATGRLLVSNPGGSSSQFVDIFADAASIPDPAATLDPITTKGQSTATFSGTVDPAGGKVGCKFQYSTDKLAWTDVSLPACGDLDATGGAQAVSRRVKGLDPNTHYFVRLVASRPAAPASTATSLVRSFETDAVPPVVSEVGAVEVQDTSMRLVGTIDPRHSPTGYVFEYGATPALGSSTPPTDIGGGTHPVVVSQQIQGLAKDTTYYFRLVATNLIGTTTSPGASAHTRTVPFPPASPGSCANGAIRTEQNSTYLPDCRAYEMVTPPDKNLGSADHTIAGHGFNAAWSGNAVIFCTSTLFGEPAAQLPGFCADYLSRRGAAGWATETPIQPFCAYDTDTGQNLGGFGDYYVFFSPELNAAASELPQPPTCSIPPYDPAAPPDKALYLEDLAAGSHTLLTTNPEAGGRAEPIAGSPDFSHVVYKSVLNQTPDSPPPAETVKLYQWMKSGEDGCATAPGCLSLLSVDPEGHPFATSSNLADEFAGNSQPNPDVSTDGERIFFQNPAGSALTGGPGGCSASCELYLREGNATTVDVSESECTSECGSGTNADWFKWATPDGKKAFFISCSKLTDDAAPTVACGDSQGYGSSLGHWGSKIYRWDEEAPPGHRLVDITVDHEPSDGIQPSGELEGGKGGFGYGRRMGLLGASEDGNTAFFATDGQLVAGEPLTTPAGEGSFGPEEGTKIYRWRWNDGSPTLDYLGAYAALKGYTEEQEVAKGATLAQRAVTPDGRYLLVQTKSRLDPVADHDSDKDVYRWGEGEGWRCVSCQPPGEPSRGDANILDAFGGTTNNSFVRGAMGGGALPMAMSDDGRVFFQTPDALLSADVNGEAGCPVQEFPTRNNYPTCEDIYEWNDGTLSLITDGLPTDHAVTLIGTNPSGRDVFFFDRRRLVGSDLDDGVDIYDARTGGGFPEPPPAPPSCEGEACRGPATVGPAAAGSGTAVFEGPGNPKAKHRKARKPRTRHHKKHGGKAKRRAANHNRRAGR